MPIPQKIGSILRIHRGQTKKIEGIATQLQLNCDVGIKGAWVLFDPMEGSYPIDKTGKHYTMANDDYAKLKDIREFSKKYFFNNEIPHINLKEAMEKKPKDFDFVGLILDIKNVEKGLKLRICDSEMVVKIIAPAKKNLYLRPQNIVRVRSANFETDKVSNILTLNEYSSILRIEKEYKTAMIFRDQIDSPTVNEKVRRDINLFTPKIQDSTIYSKILNSHGVEKYSKLQDLFSGANFEGANNYFKVRVSVLEIGPKNPKDWICIIDTKTRQQ